MHARYFSAHLGRFLSTDPVVASPGVPQAWNRYAYVQNNPVNWVDPRGMWPFFPLADIPLWDEITVTGELIPLPTRSYNPLTGVQGLGSFLSGRSFLNTLGFALFGATPTPAPTPTWVNPTGGCVRACDSFGCGGFGASRDGGSRRHMGTDFLATAGQDVLAPTSGTLTRAVNRVYASDPRYTGFVLSGTSGFTMKGFYVATDPSLIGTHVTAGDVLGTAQDLGLKYPGISNHVHLQIMDPTGAFIDPATVVPIPAGCP